MLAIVTGQVGMDKKEYLEGVRDFAGQQGETIEVYHLGDMMYAEARDVKPGRILDLPLSRLQALRRSAFKDVISQGRTHRHAIVNTHATFRWRHGLFSAFDFDQMQALAPDLFVCLVDNIEVVHHRLHRDHVIDATLKDCMVWREEEILATELLAQAVGRGRRPTPFYIMSRGRHADTAQTLFRLMCRPDMRKVYPSFPMSHVVGLPEVLAEIDAFRAALAEHFITFDPGDVDEKLLLERALEAAREGKEFLDVEPHLFGGSLSEPEAPARGRPPAMGSASVTGAAPRPGIQPLARASGSVPIRVRTREVLDIAGDIDGQIYMRDFKLVDQADMIVSYIPELPGGMPGLSSGVERELHHAFEHAKEVYVVWRPQRTPSPFITETATRVFATVAEALEYFERKGMFGQRNLFGQ